MLDEEDLGARMKLDRHTRALPSSLVDGRATVSRAQPEALTAVSFRMTLDGVAADSNRPPTKLSAHELFRELVRNSCIKPSGERRHLLSSKKVRDGRRDDIPNKPFVHGRASHFFGMVQQ
eukprot:CAMPEP_0119403752 /NCGR_PEP_ID=MMETSP1334-20130426/143544_1 /TAXON_ID=127549 /ORGANISM="Calcidiscus leptoporus, Strain RCC1130" /LENGTH=119 /DNA_ID=CAMNT_0007427703 /DNA_START=919 /DNA_END=1275 /DNA_ORIENTATION=-